MKKLLILLLIIITAFSMTACSGGDDDDGGENNTPKYSEIYTYNETTHWRNQTNGTGRTDVGEHQNDRGKCSVCDYYYDATEYLEFRKYTLGNVTGYQVYSYLDEEFDKPYLHIEVPKYYQGEDDAEPLPVISLRDAVFSTGTVNGRVYNYTRIKSIKLNEGLLEISQWAFKNSDITELVIPNSVTNEYFHTWGSTTTGIIYNLCGGCAIERFVIGNGIKVLGAYNFGNGVKEVVIGSGVETIQQRAFYEVYSLDYIIIPASCKYIPESTVSGGNYANVPLYRLLPASSKTVIYMEITKAEHDANVVPLRQRDSEGNILNPIDYGFVEGWMGFNDIYFKGEWHYDDNGKPVPNN